METGRKEQSGCVPYERGSSLGIMTEMYCLNIEVCLSKFKIRNDMNFVKLSSCAPACVHFAKYIQ